MITETSATASLVIAVGALTLVDGCASAPPADAPKESSIVAVDAGLVKTQYGRVPAWYVVDVRTRVCAVWFSGGVVGSGGVLPADCCALRRVPEVAAQMPWATDATCAAGPLLEPASPAVPSK